MMTTYIDHYLAKVKKHIEVFGNPRKIAFILIMDVESIAIKW